MQQPHNVAPHHVDAFLTPQEQQQLKAAGINTGILAGLIRAFITALLSALPGILGAQPATPGAAPTPAKP